METALPDFEKLGIFYLGKEYDLAQKQVRNDLILYDSKDLTTHAVCVGMTGSGKTGLCLSLLEEAAIDSIPVIAIDPKGDLGNLFLTFPDLRPEDFRPWIDEQEAAREGMSPDDFAAHVSTIWKIGLEGWGQSGARIRRFRDAVDMAIYTPGSTAGLPITVMKSFAAPATAILDDVDVFRERVSATASGLLALMGIDADPVRSREHILISNLLQHHWRQGRDLDIAALIREIQTPPFHTVGVLDLETFYPPKDRTDLAMTLNNLLASPSFASWLEGEPLDVKRLLYTAEGKPRLSILSIAHLSDPERMFFVTLLLNEVLAWVRTQPGTSSLRAILYMDEVFGYFPPTANPPSKTPMLTLLKQARAYGLGIVLATQNPVDLDYKGLSNTGTWFLGRLQTERDKARVLEGLEGASVQAGRTFNRQQLEATLAGLGKRVFLMNNVHEDQPVTFQTRWALSYLRGPLTRQQIKTLMDPLRSGLLNPATPSVQPGPAARSLPIALSQSSRPVIPEGLEEVFLDVTEPLQEFERLVYRPAVVGTGELYFVRATYGIDQWQERGLFLPLERDRTAIDWKDAVRVDSHGWTLARSPEEGGTFTELPAGLFGKSNVKKWQSALKDAFYQSGRLVLWRCADLKLFSLPDETEGDFRVRLHQLAVEQRDAEVAKLRTKYAAKFDSLRKRMRTADEAIQREESQHAKAKQDSWFSWGSTLLGAFLGRKVASKENVSKTSTAMKSVGRVSQQGDDVARAKAKRAALQADLDALEAALQAEIDQLAERWSTDRLALEEVEVPPRKSDIRIDELKLVWVPWAIDDTGAARVVTTT